MTKTDKMYLDLLQDIVENGKVKYSRAGSVKSVFGRQLRFDLKEGLPLLTTKKVFTKGIIHELLWFLQHPKNEHGSMNIKYLLENNVHIWDDDAYRWFKEWVKNELVEGKTNYHFLKGEYIENQMLFSWWEKNTDYKGDIDWLLGLSKEEFLELTMENVEIRVVTKKRFNSTYRFGDLGPIYGTQWRSFCGQGSVVEIDQISNIIETLKTNPNDRRMLCIAYNPSVLDSVALPPCHVMMQFYTRELSEEDRVKIYGERFRNTDNIHMDERELDSFGIPKYGLSCMFTMRSNDFCCGAPFNFAQYAILTHMIGNIVNMVPDELVYSVGDCHVYMNQMEGIREQLERKGSDIAPQLKIHGEHFSVEDFKFEDFEISDYHPDPSIKFPLNVG